MGNIGDERILHCLRLFFNGHEIRSFTIGLADNKIDEINSCDYVLIGGGGLLLRQANKFYEFINKIRRPLGLVGIGVEAMNADMAKTSNLLLEKSEFFLVRDKESSELLLNHPKVIIGPDLSFLSSYDVVYPPDQSIVGLNLRNWLSIETEYGSPFWMSLSALPKSFRTLDKMWLGKKWDERKFLSLLRTFKGAVFPMPFEFNEESSDSDFCILRKYFTSVPKTFDIGWFDKVRYVVAMRFHAVAFSVQCGIPFVCISYQPKCTRFCRSIGMDHYCLDIYSGYDKIVDRLSELEKNYEAIRQSLIFQRQKLAKDINSIMNEILTLMERQV